VSAIRKTAIQERFKIVIPFTVQHNELLIPVPFVDRDKMMIAINSAPRHGSFLQPTTADPIMTGIRRDMRSYVYNSLFIPEDAQTAVIAEMQQNWSFEYRMRPDKGGAMRKDTTYIHLPTGKKYR
jgi:hypothetical protein